MSSAKRPRSKSPSNGSSKKKANIMSPKAAKILQALVATIENDTAKEVVDALKSAVSVANKHPKKDEDSSEEDSSDEESSEEESSEEEEEETKEEEKEMPIPKKQKTTPKNRGRQRKQTTTPKNRGRQRKLMTTPKNRGGQRKQTTTPQRQRSRTPRGNRVRFTAEEEKYIRKGVKKFRLEEEDEDENVHVTIQWAKILKKYIILSIYPVSLQKISYTF